MKTLLRLASAVSIALALVPMANASPLQIWGSTTCQKRFLEPGAKDLEAATGVKIRVVGVGTGKGVLGLIKGKAPISAASSPLESAVKSATKAAKKAGQEVTIPSDLLYHEIGRDVIVPIVHQDNPVTALSWQQLSDIHTGKITNWSQVGGLDLPIRVVTSHAGSATRAVFQKQVMKKADYVSGAVKVSSTRKEIDEVSKYKGAIGAVSEGFHEQKPGKTRAVASDTIARPLGLLTLGEPTGDAKKVIDYFLAEGRKYLD